MEKAMQIKYQAKYCLNCGTWFNIKINRFPVCKCGCTEAVSIDDRRGTVETKSGILSVVIGREKITTYKYSEYTDIIPALYNLPIVNCKRVKEEIMETFSNEEKRYFSEEKCWVVLSHFINMLYSQLYRSLWKEKLYYLCHCIIEEGIPRIEEPDAEVVEKIKLVPETVSKEIMLLTMDNILSGLDEETSMLLGVHGISAYDYNTLQEKYNLTDVQLRKDIKDYAVLAYRGNEIVERIMEYYALIQWFKEDLQDESALTINENDPIYDRALFAENKKRIIINSGAYAIKKCVQKYMTGKFERYVGHISMINELIIRATTVDEVKNNKLIVDNIPKEGINKPPHVIIGNGGVIDSVIFIFKNGSVGIEGICDDEHKILANMYLDSFDEEDEQ